MMIKELLPTVVMSAAVVGELYSFGVIKQLWYITIVNSGRSNHLTATSYGRILRLIIIIINIVIPNML